MNEMTTEKQTTGMIMEDVIARGDLSKLTPEQRARHYVRVCEATGLNPLTQPFQYVMLNGRLVLYTTKTATDQLRQLHSISLKVIDRVILDGVLTVTVQATDKTGRTDEDYGAVSIGALKGDALANAQMKAITKAKRRTTLSICGLGYLDESEMETIPDIHPMQMEPRAELRQAVEPAPAATNTRQKLQREEPYRLLVPDDVDWRKWAEGFIAYVRASHTPAEVDRWSQYNEAALTAMREAEPKMFELLRGAVEQARTGEVVS